MDLLPLVDSQVDKLVELARQPQQIDIDPDSAHSLHQWYLDNRPLVDGCLRKRYFAREDNLRRELDALDRQIRTHPCYITFRKSASHPNATPATATSRAGRRSLKLLQEKRSQTAQEIRDLATLRQAIHEVGPRIRRAVELREQQEAEAWARFLQDVDTAILAGSLPAAEQHWRTNSRGLALEDFQLHCANVLANAIRTLIGGNAIECLWCDSIGWLLVDPSALLAGPDDEVTAPNAHLGWTRPTTDSLPWTTFATDGGIDIRRLAELQDLLTTHFSQQSRWRQQWTQRFQQSALSLPASKSATFLSPELSDQDHRLCAMWSNPEASRSPAGGRDPRKVGARRHDYARLVSARAAECVAADFYRALGHNVEDISLQQLLGGSNDWLTHDLSVDGQPFDVKNSRRSFSSRDSYCEHCVPKFKEARSQEPLTVKNEVRIVGVLSDYVAADDMADVKSWPATVLGDVGRSDLDALVRWVDASYQGYIRLRRLLTHGFLPGWVFEYPDNFYGHRASSVRQLGDLWLAARAAGFAVDHDWPGRRIVATLCGIEDADPDHWPDTQHELAASLRAMSREIGVSRRSLFVFSLGAMLRAISEARELECAAALRSLLFDTTGDDWTRPLGLVDSQEYVGNLIDLLMEAAPDVRGSLARIKYFVLSHPQILRGADTSGGMQTIYAYCGGWRTVSPTLSVPCGRTPLVIGRDPICPNPYCGHLVCPDCGFCSIVCPECKVRQGEVRSNLLSDQVRTPPMDDEYWAGIGDN